MLSEGEIVRDYEVIAPLTDGGMATLVLAKRRGPGGFSRLVALKFVHQHLAADEEMVRLLLDEARVAGRISHPNVVQVESVGVHEGQHFIAMEYVHGVTLATLLRRLATENRHMSTKLCVYIAATVAEALHAAHEARAENGENMDIVHRDVSPQNILITQTGHVKLIDFGVAKSREALHHSIDGHVVGKLRYMAPEQIYSEGIDRRADIYSLGVVLWEMLTMRPLFPMLRVERYRNPAFRANPPPPSQASARSKPIPEALDQAILNSLAVKPEDRQKTALQLRRELMRACRGASSLGAPKVARALQGLISEELRQLTEGFPRAVQQQLHHEAAAGIDAGRGDESLTVTVSTRVTGTDEFDFTQDTIPEAPDWDASADTLRARASHTPIAQQIPPAVLKPMRPRPKKKSLGARGTVRRPHAGLVGAVSLAVGILLGGLLVPWVRGQRAETTEAEALVVSAPQQTRATKPAARNGKAKARARSKKRKKRLARRP